MFKLSEFLDIVIKEAQDSPSYSRDWCLMESLALAHRQALRAERVEVERQANWSRLNEQMAQVLDLQSELNKVV